MHVLNIGLHKKTGGEVDIISLVEALNAATESTYAIEFHHSLTEPTAIVETPNKLTDDQIYKLATALDQQAIAAWSEGEAEGRLIGPEVEQWGAFDAQRFMLLDGKFLSVTK